MLRTSSKPFAIPLIFYLCMCTNSGFLPAAAGTSARFLHSDQVRICRQYRLPDIASAAFYTAGRLVANPFDSPALLQSLHYYLRAKLIASRDTVKTVALLSEAIQLQVNSPHYHLARARVLVKEQLNKKQGLGKFIDRDFRLALKFGVSNVEDVCEIATWYYYVREIDASERILSNAINQFPEAGQPHQMLGYIYSRHDQKYRDALEEYDKAIQLGYDTDGCLIDRAFSLAKLGKYHHAKRELDTVLGRDSENVVALVDRGAVLIALGRNQNAIDDISLAIKLDSELAEVYGAPSLLEKASKSLER